MFLCFRLEDLYIFLVLLKMSFTPCCCSAIRYLIVMIISNVSNVAPGMAMLVSLPIRSRLPIRVECCGPQWMNPNDVNDPLTFPLTPTWGRQFRVLAGLPCNLEQIFMWRWIRILAIPLTFHHYYVKYLKIYVIVWHKILFFFLLVPS